MSATVFRQLLDEPIPDGRHEGMPLRDVLAAGNAEEWIGWALSMPAGTWGDAFEDALSVAARELDRRRKAAV